MLKDGGIIIYPTETLYAVGAVATPSGPVNRVYEIKDRAYGKPVPVLVRDVSMMERYVYLNVNALSLIDEFMPGALTLVLMDRGKLHDGISAGTGKVAVRISAHPFVQGLFNHLDEPITSTSANTSGGENLFDSNQLMDWFEDKVDLIVDTGTISESKGSTVLDMTLTPPIFLREGDISPHRIKELIKW